jgi:hypothetical protein
MSFAAELIGVHRKLRFLCGVRRQCTEAHDAMKFRTPTQSKQRPVSDTMCAIWEAHRLAAP